jgi:hypothetical protein
LPLLLETLRDQKERTMQSLRVLPALGEWAPVAAAIFFVLARAGQSGARANAQCFLPEPVSGFSQEAIGGEVLGAARISGEEIEICSSSRGYGGTTDSLFGLLQDTSKEFEFTVDVVGVDAQGRAGAEARVFRGTGSDPAQAVVYIAVQADPGGAGYTVASGVRPRKSAAIEPQGARSIPVQLPVSIGVERRGNQITTFYFEEDGDTRFDHLSLSIEPDASLDASTYRVGMVHGAGDAGQGKAASGIGRFGNPRLERQQSVRPPQLDRLVENHQATVDRPAVLTIDGFGLAETEEVLVAGYQAAILEKSEKRLRVEVPATHEPVRGDIVVRTSGGTSEIPNSFFSFGRSFIRCDCNGDGTVDVSDMISMLTHLFLGGPGCVCAEAGDCNDDDEFDVSDPIRALIFLFIDGDRVPPPPYPIPGTDSSAPLCGLEDQVPRITGISRKEIREGDEFSITGSGFSERTRVVIPGARVEVTGRTPAMLTLRAGVIAVNGPVHPRLIEDFERETLPPCRPDKCSSTAIGPVSKLDEPVQLVPSGVPAPVVSQPGNEDAPIIVKLDRQSFDPTRPLEVSAFLEAPAIAGVSPGGRAAAFQWHPEKSFEESVVSLADRLRHELSGDAYLGEAYVLPEKERGQIVLRPTESFPRSFSLTGAVFATYIGPGSCAPGGTHPIANEREHGWCRFRQLVEPCRGLPHFEWFIPLGYVRSKSSSLAGLPHPSARSPHEKEIMYNWEAYCHVRRYRLWNLCTLQTLAELGRADIPKFPTGAWVAKTIWRTAGEIPAEIDRTKLYSYVYSGDGKTYYLTALHHITKDIDDWFWYDLYPAMQILQGLKGDFVRGIGGCGGTNVDAPEWVAETIWKNYFLCTNITRTQPIATGGIGGVGPTATESSAWCGNFEFASECPDVIDAANLDPASDGFADDTCLNCHAKGGYAAAGGKLIGVDFLHSIKTGPSVPFPCDGGDGPLTFAAHIRPILYNHCGCHQWMTYDKLYEKPSSTGMFYVKPNDTANSYLWRKLTGTHLAVPGGSGCAMPYDCSPTPTSLPAWALHAIKAWIESGAAES